MDKTKCYKTFYKFPMDPICYTLPQSFGALHFLDQYQACVKSSQKLLERMNIFSIIPFGVK